MKKVFFYALYVFLCISFLGCEKKNTSGANSEEELDKQAFMIYGDDFMVTPSLPDSWMVNMDAAQKYGLNGFFYLKDFDINSSPAIIALNLFGKDDFKDFNEYAKIFSDDLADYYKDYEVIKLKEDSFETKANNCKLILFEMKKKTGSGHYQQIAYIDTGNKYFIEMYIDCRSDTNEDNATFIKDFIEAVYSIDYMNIKLEMK